ncbi:hypothetical protein BDZ45DRAFT_352171 [Acephala macrosclerotiorum]|nr:hypothetical protein BDZ45DRAFT_352171 [Acephala macrosclerotiorum]
MARLFNSAMRARYLGPCTSHLRSSIMVDHELSRKPRLVCAMDDCDQVHLRVRTGWVVVCQYCERNPIKTQSIESRPASNQRHVALASQPPNTIFQSLSNTRQYASLVPLQYVKALKPPTHYEYPLFQTIDQETLNPRGATCQTSSLTPSVPEIANIISNAKSIMLRFSKVTFCKVKISNILSLESGHESVAAL